MERVCLTNTIELRKLMAENGFYTISALASASKINRNTLGRVLEGAAQPSADIMYKLTIALKMSPEQAGTVFFARNFRNA